MAKRPMTTLVIVALWMVGFAWHLVACSRQAPSSGAAAPEPATSASSVPPAGPAGPRGAGQDDLLKGLKALLFADQSLKDELASMAQFDPQVKQVMASVERGDCADATRRSTEPGDSAPSAGSLLVVAYVGSACGDRAGAVDALKRFLAAVNGFSHPTLQTWFRLRQLGVEPEQDKSREVLGLIVEIGFSEGTDVVAAYADGSSRFFGKEGGSVLGAEQRVEVQEAARRVISVAAPFEKSAHKETARGQVAAGVVRFTFLTPGGPRVVEATKDDLKAGTSELQPLFNSVAELRFVKIRGKLK